MAEQPDRRCFVLLPAGDSRYTRLFDELFAPAIMEAGLIPVGMDQDNSTPLPVTSLLQKIAQADAVFADVSQNDLDLWLALGSALALGKPLCLVSSRLEFSLSLDIQDLEIIPYPSTPFPNDYRNLHQNIIEQLLAKLPRTNTPQLPVRPMFIKTQASTSPFTPAIAYPSEISEDLTSYEILALMIIDSSPSDQGLSPRALGLEMQLNDSAHLTSHAMNSLRRRKLIERKPVQLQDGNEDYTSENLFLTQFGEKWLIRNGRRKEPARADSPAPDLLQVAVQDY